MPRTIASGDMDRSGLAVYLRVAAILLLFAPGAGLPVIRAQLPVPSTPTALQAHKSSQAPPSAERFRIAGHAVDAADGRSLQHARVTLSGNGAGHGASEVETDTSGAFAFQDLPRGRYRLQGAMRGYITAAYDEHEDFSSAIVTGAGADTEALRLQLQPAAAVYGRITDEAGDGVRHATVTLFRENLAAGTRRITQFRTARTDDLGAYEIARLPPGVYFAAVRALPWYATYPQMEGQPGDTGLASSIDPALNVAYPLTFYPEATDSGGAAAIRLKAGDRFHANFRLTPQPAMQLSLHLPGPVTAGFDGRNIPQLQQKVFDEYEGVQLGVQIIGSTLQMSGLPAGPYVLRQLGTGSYDGPARNVDLTTGSGTVEVSPAPSFGTVTLTLAPPADAAFKPPAALQVALVRPDSTEGQPTARVKDGQVEFANLAPGDYRIEPANPRFHVESITEGGRTRAGALLHVTGEGQAATLTLSTASVAIGGYAQRDGQGVSGVMVILVPAGGDHGVALYHRDQSDLDGSFRLADVLPGNYLLLAVEKGWSLEWRKPEALAPYLGKAVPVTVPPDGHGSMKIGEGVAVQALQ